MASAAHTDLSAQIAALGAQIKQLKTAGQPCEAEVKQLLELKTQAGLPTSSKKSKGSGLVLKTPKVSLGQVGQVGDGRAVVSPYVG